MGPTGQSMGYDSLNICLFSQTRLVRGFVCVCMCCRHRPIWKKKQTKKKTWNVTTFTYADIKCKLLNYCHVTLNRHWTQKLWFLWLHENCKITSFFPYVSAVYTRDVSGSTDSFHLPFFHPTDTTVPFGLEWKGADWISSWSKVQARQEASSASHSLDIARQFIKQVNVF